MLVHNVLVEPDRVTDVEPEDGCTYRVDGLGADRDEREPADGQRTYQWVCLSEPDPDELARLGAEFGMHPLAVEDAGAEHQRPKAERYGDLLFVVLRTLRHVGSHTRLALGEVNLFVGPDFVVTVLHGDAARRGLADLGLDNLQEHLGARNRSHGPMGAAHAVCDAVVDSYEELGAALEKDVDNLDVAVFADDDTPQLPRIHFLKRQLADVRRATRPLHEPLLKLATSEHMPDRLKPYMRDVADHLHRLTDGLEHMDDLISSAYDAYATQISLRQNEDMRKISAGGALVIVPTLIAGIYGMNFKHMPELEWQYGYGLALLAMAATVGVLWLLFKRGGWM